MENKDRFIISTIIPDRLYLSGIEPTYSISEMKSFTHILSLVQEDFSTIAMIGKRKKVILLIDDTSQELPIKDACTWIKNALLEEHSKVLVHCHAGISRSAAIITAYLMISNMLNFDKAYQIVQNAREIVDINYGFKLQLLNLGDHTQL